MEKNFSILLNDIFVNLHKDENYNKIILWINSKNLEIPDFYKKDKKDDIIKITIDNHVKSEIEFYNEGINFKSHLTDKPFSIPFHTILRIYDQRERSMIAFSGRNKNLVVLNLLESNNKL